MRPSGAGIFCVRADAAAEGTARTPVVARHDGITVAVNGGDDPGRARALRDADRRRRSSPATCRPAGTAARCVRARAPSPWSGAAPATRS